MDLTVRLACVVLHQKRVCLLSLLSQSGISAERCLLLIWCTQFTFNNHRINIFTHQLGKFNFHLLLGFYVFFFKHNANYEEEQF